MPQGSILGPLLFICYVNDLHRHCVHTLPYVYADDTALLCTGETPDEVAAKLQSELDHLSNWFAFNRLSVNTSKTKSMLFTSTRSRFKDSNIEVTLCSQSVEQVSEIKYLGLLLDPHLSFDRHINRLCGKINSRAKMLWRMRGFIDAELAKKLYVSLIHPHLLYCNFVLDGTTEGNKSKLQVQQNSALRAVLDVDYMYPSAKLLSDVGVDSVRVCMAKTTCKLVYRGFYNIGPPALNNMFVAYVPTRELRSGDQLLVDIPRCHTEFARKNIAVRGGYYWNALPPEIKSCMTIDLFKLSLKKYIGFG